MTSTLSYKLLRIEEHLKNMMLNIEKVMIVRTQTPNFLHLLSLAIL